MPPKRNRDNVNERFASFTPVMFQRGQVIHAVTLYAPSKTACGKKARRVHVHFLRRIDCIDCLAALFYRVPVAAMKAWLDRNDYQASDAVVKAAVKRGRK
jgi:hypothetical protein